MSMVFEPRFLVLFFLDLKKPFFPPAQEASKEVPRPPSFSMKAEMERLQVNEEKWRLTELNRNFEMSASYPPLIYVPAQISDDTLAKAAKFRSKGRVPALTWFNSRKGNALLRSSQPNVGLAGHSSKEDQLLIEEARATLSGTHDLVIFDARSKLAAEV